jgi:hypothetical protein
VGEPGAISGNSVHCRLDSAIKAQELEPEFYCPRAGPGGADGCGTYCESYCHLMKEICPGTFPDPSTCPAACATVPVLDEGFSAETQRYGNSIQCRLIHVANSATYPIDHCPHAAGTRTCIDRDGG